MGCYCSTQERSEDNYRYDQWVHYHRDRKSELTTVTVRSNRPCYGQYKCSCGRFWSSMLSWPNNAQSCKKCRRRVYPHFQRALLPTDKPRNVKGKEHQEDLCQMCQTLGYYCGKLKNNNHRRTK